MGSYKKLNGEIVEFEGPYYRVEPEGSELLGVYVKDMDLAGDEGPLFYIAASHRSELAAVLLGVSTEEVEMFMNVIQEGSAKDDEEKWLMIREKMEEA
jgi:hypothetical protein